MKQINEISLKEFAETMNIIGSISRENKKLFNEILMDICKECRLANEMLFYIVEMQEKEMLKSPEIVYEHHQVILAIWLLLNGYESSDTTIH